MTTTWTAGVVRHGEADPVPARFRYRRVPERCGTYGHPGVTYHPWLDRTWCQCGAVARDGDQCDWAYAHPASPLLDWWDTEARDTTIQHAVDHGCPVPDYDHHRQQTIFDALEAL